MRIKVRLSAAGVKQAQKELRQYRTALNKRIKEFAKRLAEEGCNVAKLRFSSAAYDGDNDVSVVVEQDGTKARIIASGKSVLFIEFGTGAAYPEHPSGMYAHGTYGAGKGANKNGWVYAGQPGTGGQPVTDRKGNVKEGVYRTKGNPPAEAMWTATTEMAAKIQQIWDEVMRQ